ncbi:hypothetical protein CEXT_722811 [Caerostris extrusa]|uniref:Uncharacterized protein n=1 Tax=Caerostris extrusa TaxID=172846 RepID=A0AAV4RGI8_CAEEX|nr:hypothetical protein CEXT_722811 [Caerostris extrusa]
MSHYGAYQTIFIVENTATGRTKLGYRGMIAKRHMLRSCRYADLKELPATENIQLLTSLISAESLVNSKQSAATTLIERVALARLGLRLLDDIHDTSYAEARGDLKLTGRLTPVPIAT